MPLFIPDAQTLMFNVKDYGATGNGTTDDTTAIQAAINAASTSGGIVFLPAGTFIVSTNLTLSSTSVRLVGTGGNTIIEAKSSFSGSQIILLSADFTGISDLSIYGGPSTTYSSNVATNGVQITGARSCYLHNVYINYVNGWGVQSSATASVANYWTEIMNVHTFQCAQGIHVLGVTGSGFNMGHYLVDCNVDQTENGDGLLIEDAHDVFVSNLNGTIVTGAGSSLHIKGACAAMYATSLNLGPAPGPATSSTVLIESGTNGTPKQITLNTGMIQGGSAGITISAGSEIKLLGCDLLNNGTYGVNISGGDAITIDRCIFDQNGSSGSSGRYDFQSSTSGHVYVTDCLFQSPQGAAAQHTNNAINVTAGSVVLRGDTFYGTGYNSSNIFNGFPSIIQNCPGYNPVGSVGISLPSSSTNFSVKSTDLTYFVGGGTVSAIAIGGVSTGLTSGSFRVPAQQTFSITYSVAPTVVAFSD